MKTIGLYFSGTGNTELICKHFLSKIDTEATAYSIEYPHVDAVIKSAETIILAYPIYYSCLPKIMSDFIENHKALWKEKRVFILASMAMFSGDGCGVASRGLQNMVQPL